MTENEKIADMLKTLNKKAMLAISSQNYEIARDSFEQAFILESQLGMTKQAAESNVNIANVLFLMKDYKKAQQKLESSLEIFHAQKNRAGMYRVNQLLGEIFYQTQEYSQALERFEECITLQKGTEKEWIACFQAAASHFKMENFAKSQSYLEKALKGFERIGNIQGQIDTLKQRALLFQKTGKARLAAMDLDKCKRLSSQENR